MAALTEYFTMGGYAGYVWASYGVTAILLLGMLIASQRLLRRNQAVHELLAPADLDKNKDGTVEEKT